jgi:hypothetical protein
MKGFPPLAKNCLKTTNQMLCHLADLHSVGNQFESLQGKYFLFMASFKHSDSDNIMLCECKIN